MLDIKIEKTTCPKEKPAASTLGFGKKFSDHMFVMEYKEGEGWKNPRIIPFGNISLSPASTVFHYGAEIFEGMKAYRTPDGKIQMFRPYENAKRMNNSAERICLPEIPEEDFVQALEALVKIDADWVPHEPETSLYLRPFTIANDPFLGVHPATEAIFMIIASPVGSYYAEGLNPVSIMIETEDVRAVRGGTGYAKCGGNYGASLRAGKKAEEKGYSQVLWLDGVERKYIEEVGAMNVMFMVGDEIITPALTGSILPGITRKSCIELLRSRGYKVTERQFSLEELKVACENGTLKEAWGCGTAAVVSPIGKLVIGDESYIINNNEIGAVTQELYDTLTGIQWGKIEDTFGWVYPVV
ncbi:MAG: branched-chain amino acid aminotransferase [Oscillospiraceae bacterium]|nr:branched-chain amino acid aminotransferase [Oscillospiraceae bacterium]